MVRDRQLVDRRGVLRGRRVVLVFAAAALFLAIGVIVGTALAHATRQLAVLTANPTHLTFVARAPGGSASVQTLRITNIGTAPAVPHTPALSGSAASDYTVTDNSCIVGLAPRQGCTLRITHQGARRGTQTATLSLPYTGGRGPLEVPLHAIARPLSGHVTVKASASPPQAGSVSATSSTAGASCSGGSCMVPGGGTVTLTASANPGYAFDAWSGACAGQSSLTCTLSNITGQENATANFAPKHAPKLSVGGSASPSAAGSVSATSSTAGASCSGGSCMVPGGGTVTLTASANPGYAFDAWSGACAGQSSLTCTLSNITGQENATANFSMPSP